MHKKSTKSNHRRNNEGERPHDEQRLQASTSVPLETKDPSELRKYQKRKIQNNWEKYDLITVDDKDEAPTGLQNDFLFVLKNAPADITYFQLSSEKEWDKSQTNDNVGVLQLDLNLLSNGLATIPFYERVGIELSRFGEDDIKRCNHNATKNQEHYNKLVHDLDVADHGSVKDTNLKSNVAVKSELNKEVTNVCDPSRISLADNETEVNDISVESDFKESLKDFVEVTSEHMNDVAEEDQELEDWLDGVLDS